MAVGPPFSGWFIDDVELPIAPDTDERSISRSFQSETLFNFFPSITKSSARAFDYTITGIIYPEDKAFELDQIAKSADTNTVVITIPDDQKIFLTTKYAVKKLVINRRGPLFTKFAPPGSSLFVEVQALRYTLTLTELPDEGEFQEGVDGFTDADETGIGLQQVNEINETVDININVDDYSSLEIFAAFIAGQNGAVQL